MEQNSFNTLMLRYRGLLFSVCRRYGRRGLDEDDLLQEVLLVLWQRREQMFSITSAPLQAAWVWRVARNACVDLRRRAPESVPLPVGYDMADDDRALSLSLRELIDLLPEPDRTIITLHLEGYDYREIGRKTGLTKSNVGVRLMRAKDKLKQQWNRE